AGLAVVAATSLLAANPLPPKPAAEALALAASERTNPALPLPGDVTFGSGAGEVLVGLSLRPGTPGRNDILVYLQPPDGEAAAAGEPRRVQLHVPGPGPDAHDGEHRLRADHRGAGGLLTRPPGSSLGLPAAPGAHHRRPLHLGLRDPLLGPPDRRRRDRRRSQ